MLHCAASRGRMVLTDWLLDNIFMDNPNVKNDLGETPLHLAAGYFTKGIQSLFTITIIYFFKYGILWIQSKLFYFFYKNDEKQRMIAIEML